MIFLDFQGWRFWFEVTICIAIYYMLVSISKILPTRTLKWLGKKMDLEL